MEPVGSIFHLREKVKQKLSVIQSHRVIKLSFSFHFAVTKFTDTA